MQRRRMPYRRALREEVNYVNPHEFTDDYHLWYDHFYNAHKSPICYKSAVDAGDLFLSKLDDNKNWLAMMKPVYELRTPSFDPYSSDREVAALACTLRDYGVIDF